MVLIEFDLSSIVKEIRVGLEHSLSELAIRVISFIIVGIVHHIFLDFGEVFKFTKERVSVGVCVDAMEAVVVSGTILFKSFSIVIKLADNLVGGILHGKLLVFTR